MRHYETTCILRPNLGEEQLTEIIERSNALVTDAGGAIIHLDRWGVRKLAYEIDKETQGYYVCTNYAADGPVVAEMERLFRIDDRVMRYLSVKLADSIDADSIEAEREKVIQAKQIAARDPQVEDAEADDSAE